MSTIVLEAETRTDTGKGASRRLRRLEAKVPGILYGGNKEPKSIHLLQKNVLKALETESIYSSVFDIKVDGKVEHVILKALQRHPYKPIILHMDLQRVSAKDVLVKLIPLHFTNEDSAKGIKEGGVISHSMTQVEVRCQAKNLPEFIEVDVADLALDDVLHLSDLALPKNVELTVDLSDGSHNLPVVSIHIPKKVVEPEEEIAAEEAAAEEAAAEEEQSTEAGEEKPADGDASEKSAE